MQLAGLIFDDSKHYLDHLGPFCALAKCPLILCEPELVEIASRYYPDLNVRYVPFWELTLAKFTISCDNQALLKATFPHQSTKVLWLPHGNSDKGWNRPHFEALSDEIALVYGQKMVDFMQSKGVFLQTIRVGNFRYDYFKDKSTVPDGKTFLYAPTWDNDSFWKAFPLLAKNVPSGCKLWVKLHPNTVKKFAPEIEMMIGKYAKENIAILPDEPPIYPLLAKCAAYIGDMSSIGYDFLTFNRPMYFLNANKTLPLHQVGLAIEGEHFDFKLQNDFCSLQKSLYEYTFAKKTDWKDELNALCGL